MGIHRSFAIVALLIAAGCGSSKSPWARKMTKAERVAWPTKCGIPADRVSANDGQGDYAYTSVDGQVRDEPPKSGLIVCSLLWNRDSDRLAHLQVRLGRDGALTVAEIEPLLALALAELRPADQVIVRGVAIGELGSASASGLEIRGGFSSERRRWELSIGAR